jgi:hypothetical protein
MVTILSLLFEKQVLQQIQKQKSSSGSSVSCEITRMFRQHIPI